jgi:hypothetical protein
MVGGGRTATRKLKRKRLPLVSRLKSGRPSWENRHLRQRVGHSMVSADSSYITISSKSLPVNGVRARKRVESTVATRTDPSAPIRKRGLEGIETKQTRSAGGFCMFASGFARARCRHDEERQAHLVPAAFEDA